MSAATPCKSCGNAVGGLYCTACGEKVLTHEDHTLKHYLGALLNAFTFADSKFWNTLKAVVLRPGELSAAYMEGRRVRYMRPVAFFFLANFIYFLAPVFETFNTRLNSQMHYLAHSSWVKAKVERSLASTGRTLEEFTSLYEPASSNNAKLLLVVMVFVLFVPILAIFFGKRTYLSAYVTAAFEMMAFHVWVTTIALGLLFAIVILLLRTAGVQLTGAMTDTYTQWPALALHMWVTIGIGRRFFGCSLAGSIWRSLAMLFGLQVALSAYRILLFSLTFWQIG